MKARILAKLVALFARRLTFGHAGYAVASDPVKTAEEVLVADTPPGISGGSLVVGLRSEPKTLNPVFSNDASSREVIAQTTADLIHINRSSQQPELALARLLEGFFRWAPLHGGTAQGAALFRRRSV